MDSPFVSIVSNEGVWCMIENFDKLESYRKRARVWVYVFGDSMLLPKQSDCLSEKYFQDFGNGTGICVRNLHKFSANLLFDNQNGIRNQPVSVYGLRPKSNISKQGQALRSYCFNLRISRLTSNMIDSRSNKVNSNSRDCQCNKTDMEKEAASSVELLSLSSAGMEPSVFSIDSTDVATSSMKHESESFDQIKSIPVVSCSSSFKAISMEKIQVHQEEIQQDLLSGLLRTEKESTKFSNLMGEISTNLAAFLELQTIKNSDLETIKELGSGAYGTVCSGKWNGSDVAIKRIKPSCLTEDSVERDRLVADFWKEAYLLGQLNHPNVVALYGVVTDGAVDNLATVTEYMVNGSLRQVLRRMDRTIDRRKRIILAMDAASGMEYLHQKNIVHFDLKSPNLLVNMRNPQKPVCKICDLGLSRIKKQGYVPGGARGTIPWMAPELLDSQKKMVTEKVDVYSFGIVMWELLTGEEPHVNLRSEEIAPIIKGTLRPQIPSWCDPVWRSLMERCWSSDPECRPAFSEIVKELRAMSAAMNIK